MSVVEVNTFFAVLKRGMAHPFVRIAFKVSWLLIRVLWFSYLPFHVVFFMQPWPFGVRGVFSRVFMISFTTGFAVLQLYWTQQGLKGQSD